MDDLKLIQIAQHHAAKSGHGYAQGAGFMPHPWVIEAMREVAINSSYQCGYDDGHAAGYSQAVEDDHKKREANANA